MMPNQLNPYHVLFAALALVAVLAQPVQAALTGLWFELGGVYAGVDPVTNPEVVAFIGKDLPVSDINSVAGLELTVHQALTGGFGLFLRSGYTRGTHDVMQTRTIFLPGGVTRNADYQERINIIPVTLGAELAFQKRDLSTVFELGGTVHFVQEGSQYFESGTTVMSEFKSSYGVMGSLAVHWQPFTKWLGGVRIGYVSGQTVEFPGFSVPGDSGFAQVFIGVKPWAQ